ncbi:MAG: SPW repeat protein [Acidobacteriota bacterium]|nr:SPW repeat protein [Acidobacteriota bacterium]
MKWTTWATIALGLWLMISALLPGFGPSTAARAESLALGILIMGIASWPALAGGGSRFWAAGLCLLGLWVATAPYWMGYVASATERLNDLVVGLAVVVVNALVLAFGFSRGVEAS